MADENTRSQHRRKLLVGLIVIVLAAAGIWFVLSGNNSDPVSRMESAMPPSSARMTDLARQPVGERTHFEIYENRLRQVEEQVDSIRDEREELARENEELRRNLESQRQANEEIQEEANAMIEQFGAALDEANARSTASASSSQSWSPAGQGSEPDPFRQRGVVEADSSRAGGSSTAGLETSGGRALHSVVFSTATQGESASLQRAVIRDPNNYVPPNSYASARVLVGVDAATGTSFSSDPKPVLLRISGQARSAIEGGQVYETDIEGCLVNGAAYGELSSERVYVRLQRMTCPVNDGSGRISESSVEGYVVFAGKAGVRGRVISREGDLTERALIAGTLQGLGNAFSRVGQPGTLGGLTGAAELPSASDIAISSAGSGVSSAASQLAQYYIQRAEQYQPVIEMPTGIDVEIVFLSGVVVR